MANASQQEEAGNDLGSFQLLHQVLRLRGADRVQKPLMAFPQSGKGVADFEYFTGKDLDQFADRAAWHYSRLNLKVTESNTVALLGATDLNWVASAFGLSRAEYTVLTLSPRLSSQAIVKLMGETRCNSLIYQVELRQLGPVIDEVKALLPIQTEPMLHRGGYDQPESLEPPFERNVDIVEERKRPASIMHSSGSTGLPKAIYITHDRYTRPFPIGTGDRDLVTLPLYHSFAFQVCPVRMYERKTVYFLHPHLPLTRDGLIAVMREVQPTTLCAVPYVLKLLGEQEDGLEALKSCRQVLYTGSQCPDELGDRLVDSGVNLACFVGSTECGFIGTSLGRPTGDNAWAYIRPLPSMMRNIWAKPIGEGTYEFVFLRDYPSRITSNSDDPPESFHSRDIFMPHKTIPNAWKYLGRLDDRVTLLNGEKVLPLAIEGRIKESALVKEALVFGIGRSIPGVLLFRADAAQSLSDGEFLDQVWPEIEAANRNAESFSQIGRGMMVPLPAGVQFARTDKGSIIRARVYESFAEQITAAYDRLEGRQEGSLDLELPALEKHLLILAQEVVGPHLSNIHTDLFTAGMNSLQAIQLRSLILRDLYLGGDGKRLSQNVVFEKSNIAGLARYLHGFRSGKSEVAEEPFEMMRDMIAKYSEFPEHRQTTESTPVSQVIVLTGATGNLGAHVLTHLLVRPEVEKVYCLVRGDAPLLRVQKSIQDRGLVLPNTSKLSALSSDLSAPDLGLNPSTYSTLLSRTTLVIHCAWPVNFQLSLQSFEPHIKGVHNLIKLSLSVTARKPAHFVFCSSVSAALGARPPVRIPEAAIHDLSYALDMGYGRSKLVSEHIVEAAVKSAGLRATILRIGQVVGDTALGLWNDSEAIPLIIRSALTMRSLPELRMMCQWLPVDTLAACLTELVLCPQSLAPEKMSLPGDSAQSVEKGNGGTSPAPVVYNLLSPHAFSWTSDLLPALSGLGIAFKPISVAAWTSQLRALASAPSGVDAAAAADPERNPAVKLVGYFESSLEGREGADDGANEEQWRVVFEIEGAKRDSRALRETPKIVESGLLGKMVARWMEKWGDSGVVI